MKIYDSNIAPNPRRVRILALVAVDFAKPVRLRMTPGQTNLKRWYDAVSSRPSAKA